MAESVRLRPWVRVVAAVIGTVMIVCAPLAVAEAEWTDGICAVIAAIIAWDAAVTGRSRRVSWQRSRNPVGD